MDSVLTWSTIITLIYATFYLSLLFILSCITYNKDDSKTKWLSKIWKRRKIYGPILVHIYDTSTDIGVMIIWGNQAFKEINNPKKHNIEHIDMLTMFILGCIFIGLYRIFLCFMFTLGDDKERALLAFFDLAIFKEVYKTHKEGPNEKGEFDVFGITGIQLMEAVLESVPQILLQSVYLIRTYNDNNNVSTSQTIFIFISIFSSLISITTKFTTMDQEAFAQDMISFSANLCKSDSCNGYCKLISIPYVLRIIWRYCIVLSRCVIYIMTWAVMGGVFLAIYFAYQICLGIIVYWFIFTNDKGEGFHMTVIIHLVTLLFVDSQIEWIIHVIDTILIMCIITIFSFFDFKCNICTDENNRNFFENSSVMIYVVAGWIGIFVFSVLTVFAKITGWWNLVS